MTWRDDVGNGNEEQGILDMPVVKGRIRKHERRRGPVIVM